MGAAENDGRPILLAAGFDNGRIITVSGVSAGYPAVDVAWETLSGRALVL